MILRGEGHRYQTRGVSVVGHISHNPSDSGGASTAHSQINYVAIIDGPEIASSV